MIETGENIGTIIFGVILTLWGLFLCYLAAKNIILFRNAKSFPSVLGTIQSTKIITVRPSSSDDVETYYPEVQYKYIVDGIHYESAGIDFVGQSWPSRMKAQAIIDKYPKYSQVRVYYKPENPKLSALKSGMSPMILWWAIGGPFMLGLGVVFLLGVFGIIPWNR